MGGQNIAFPSFRFRTNLSSTSGLSWLLLFRGEGSIVNKLVSHALVRDGNLQSSPRWYIVLLVLGSELLAAGFRICKAPFEGLHPEVGSPQNLQ